jgi:hypothetical protein
MKRRTIISSFLGILLMGVSLLVGIERASALTYQQNIGMNFTFNQSLNVALSADLVINDLTPGTSADSNVVKVTVNSNNLGGYKLGATVGSATEDNDNGAIYNTDKLIHASYTSADNTNIATGIFNKPIFTNLTTTTATLADFSDNTWGYSYSLDGGTTWINAHETVEGTKDTGYNGLPLYTSTPAEMKATTGPSAAGGDTVQFKIAAKASTTQASGEYNNVVNFVATGETNPKGFYEVFADAGKQMYNGYYKMQDMTSTICNTVATPTANDNTDTPEAQLIDTRDNKIYWVAKLKDGK